MFQLITTSQVGLKVVPVVRCELNDGLQIRVPTGSMKSATRLKIKLKQSITFTRRWSSHLPLFVHWKICRIRRLRNNNILREEKRNIWHSQGPATGHTRDDDGRLWRCGLADLMIGVTKYKTVELHRVAHLGGWGLIADLKHCGACALWHQMLVLTGTTTCQRRSLPQSHNLDNIYFSSTCKTHTGTKVPSYQETKILISWAFKSCPLAARIFSACT